MCVCNSTGMPVLISRARGTCLPTARSDCPRSGRRPTLAFVANTAEEGADTGRPSRTLETDWSVSKTEMHYADQLARAGWKRIGGSVDETVGWSSWQLPGDGNWQGLLLVLAAFRPGEQSLTLRVEQREPSEEDWSAYSVSSQSP